MATAAFAPTLTRRISLTEIDAAVSIRLGPTRVPGNAQPACFNRQVAMYLARHVGRWSTTVIGRFYGRDHSTVCHGIQRIEFLRDSNSEVDALLAELKLKVCGEPVNATLDNSDDLDAAECSRVGLDELADLVAVRVCAYLEKRLQKNLTVEYHASYKTEKDSSTSPHEAAGSNARNRARVRASGSQRPRFTHLENRC